MSWAHVSITLPEEVWERVIDCKFAHRIGNQAETVRQLIDRGLNSFEAERGGKVDPNSC